MESKKSKDKETAALLDFPEHLRVYLQRTRNDESLPNVVFIVENERLSAHRWLVAAASPVLREMLTNGMKETKQREIPLKEVNVDIWRKILDYIYTGRIDLVNIEIALRYLECAERFQMDELEKAISSYIELNLDTSNCCEVLSTMDRIYSMRLWKTAMNVLENSFCDLYHRPTFAKLSYDFVLKILRRRKLVVRSELDVFLAAVHWTLCSGVSRMVSESNSEILKRACEMLKQNDLGIDGLEGVNPGTGDTGNYSDLLNCVDMSLLSNADLRRAARFCRDLCEETQTTYNVNIVFLREFGEKAVEKLLTLNNPITSVPIPLCDRGRHGRYDTLLAISQRFGDVQSLIRSSALTKSQRSPILVDKTQKKKWYLKVYFRGYNEQVRDKFLSCYLCRKVEDSSEEEYEFDLQIYAKVGNDDGLSTSTLFSKSDNKETIRNNYLGWGWGYPKFMPLSALRGKDTILIGATVYFKSK